jgi:sortase A
MSTVDEMRWTEGTDVPSSTPGAPPDQESGHGPREGAPRPTTRLARRFVEQIIEDALDARRRRDPSAPSPSVDWDALWAAGEGAATPEQGVGRIVVAAESLARVIAAGTNTSVSSGATRAPEVGSTGTDSNADTDVGPDVSDRRNGTANARTAPPAPSGTELLTPAGPSGPSGVLASALPLEVPVLALGPQPGPEPPTLPAQMAERAAIMLRRQRLATVFAWVRNAGFALILFAGWQLWGTSIAQHQAQDTLQQQFTARVHRTPVTPTTAPGVTLISADVQVPEPHEGTVVGHLQIPAIGVDQYVVEGTAENDLQMGPGHYIGTSMPGQAGNVAIAGHRTTYGAPFNNLNEMVPGDIIDLTTDSGEALQYVVTQAPVAVVPSDVKILNSFGDNRLTLTTCNPRYSASQRLVVVALLRTPVAPTPTTTTPPVTHVPSRPRLVASESSVGWNLSYLPGVLGVLFFIVLLGLANRRAALYYGRVGRWIILVPIWVAATYLLFGLLSSLVPATL